MHYDSSITVRAFFTVFSIQVSLPNEQLASNSERRQKYKQHHIANSLGFEAVLGSFLVCVLKQMQICMPQAQDRGGSY